MNCNVIRDSQLASRLIRSSVSLAPSSGRASTIPIALFLETPDSGLAVPSPKSNKWLTNFT
jgi:hypothetical protein